MPRAYRYIVEGRTYHISQRCHNRSFLLRFARDRDAYRTMMRERVRRMNLRLLTYCITSNHVHLLVSAPTQDPEVISSFMQSLAGDFAQAYNIRKKRSGAYWGDRYHATMIDGGEHLWNCVKYIDLNMVRAGAVEHPRDWPWTGYQELMGLRKRYRLLQVPRLLELLRDQGLESFRVNYAWDIEQAIAQRKLSREPKWTESMAVGGEEYVREVSHRIRNRMQVEIEEDAAQRGSWVVREAQMAYS